MASSSSKASDSSSQRPKRPDQGPSGKDAAGLVALHGKLAQLKRQVQSTRLAAIKASARPPITHLYSFSSQGEV
jgi:histone-lysine N-methyltransferase EZH2